MISGGKCNMKYSIIFGLPFQNQKYPGRFAQQVILSYQNIYVPCVINHFVIFCTFLKLLIVILLPSQKRKMQHQKEEFWFTMIFIIIQMCFFFSFTKNFVTNILSLRCVKECDCHFEFSSFRVHHLITDIFHSINSNFTRSN